MANPRVGLIKVAHHSGSSEVLTTITTLLLHRRVRRVFVAWPLHRNNTEECELLFTRSLIIAPTLTIPFHFSRGYWVRETKLRDDNNERNENRAECSEKTRIYHNNAPEICVRYIQNNFIHINREKARVGLSIFSGNIPWKQSGSIAPPSELGVLTALHTN